MQVSNEKILTPHVGSLQRSKAVTETVFAVQAGRTVVDAADVIDAKPASLAAGAAIATQRLRH